MKRLIFTRIGLLLGAVAIILLVLPRASHTSFTYEEGQPWKYRLLTAEFDVPVYMDAAGATRMRDSLSRTFAPFVITLPEVATQQTARLRNLMADKNDAGDVEKAVQLLQNVYAKGILTPALADSVARRGLQTLRTMQDGTDDPTTATTISSAGMHSPSTAFAAIDSAYRASHNGDLLTENLAKALLITIQPNVVLDSATDSKYRSQELLSINAAQGVVKKGQRIVDLGEIVTPQIYTILQTYEAMLSERNLEKNRPSLYWLGQVLYLLVVYGLFYLFLANARPQYYSSIRHLTFLVTFIMVFVLLAVLAFESLNYGIYLVPFAAVPLVVLIFMDSRTGVMALLTAVLLSSVVATFQYQFLFMELAGGLAAVFYLRQLTKRSQFLGAAAMAFCGYVLAYFIAVVLETGSLETFNWRVPGILGINCVVLSFAYFIIVLVERLFGFTSPVTLIELSDINGKLLRRLSEEAPGTFQHSMQVSTLAADAARAVGANVQLVRTGALYHDIGKLASPIFYTENQHGVNPHDGLSPEASAAKIISHVKEGQAMAARHKLPAVIRSFISEHHGRGLAKYFYAMAAKENPDVDAEQFRYPGPDPQSRETAILMMADAVEAASRSLTDYSEASIKALVDRIVDSQVADGRLAQSPLSFRDVAVVKDTFRKRLATIYHARVAYPTAPKPTHP